MATLRSSRPNNAGGPELMRLEPSGPSTTRHVNTMATCKATPTLQAIRIVQTKEEGEDPNKSTQPIGRSTREKARPDGQGGWRPYAAPVVKNKCLSPRRMQDRLGKEFEIASQRDDQSTTSKMSLDLSGAFSRDLFQTVREGTGAIDSRAEVEGEGCTDDESALTLELSVLTQPFVEAVTKSEVKESGTSLVELGSVALPPELSKGTTAVTQSFVESADYINETPLVHDAEQEEGQAPNNPEANTTETEEKDIFAKTSTDQEQSGKPSSEEAAFWSKCATMAATAVMTTRSTNKVQLAQIAAEGVLTSYPQQNGAKEEGGSWQAAAACRLEDVAGEVSMAIMYVGGGGDPAASAAASAAAISILNQRDSLTCSAKEEDSKTEAEKEGEIDCNQGEEAGAIETLNQKYSTKDDNETLQAGEVKGTLAKVASLIHNAEDKEEIENKVLEAAITLAPNVGGADSKAKEKQTLVAPCTDVSKKAATEEIEEGSTHNAVANVNDPVNDEEKTNKASADVSVESLAAKKTDDQHAPGAFADDVDARKKEGDEKIIEAPANILKEASAPTSAISEAKDKAEEAKVIVAPIADVSLEAADVNDTPKEKEENNKLSANVPVKAIVEESSPQTEAETDEPFADILEEASIDNARKEPSPQTETKSVAAAKIEVKAPELDITKNKEAEGETSLQDFDASKVASFVAEGIRGFTSTLTQSLAESEMRAMVSSEHTAAHENTHVQKKQISKERKDGAEDTHSMSAITKSLMQSEKELRAMLQLEEIAEENIGGENNQIKQMQGLRPSVVAAATLTSVVVAADTSEGNEEKAITRPRDDAQEESKEKHKQRTVDDRSPQTNTVTGAEAPNGESNFTGPITNALFRAGESFRTMLSSEVKEDQPSPEKALLRKKKTEKPKAASDQKTTSVMDIAAFLSAFPAAPNNDIADNQELHEVGEESPAPYNSEKRNEDTKAAEGRKKDGKTPTVDNEQASNSFYMLTSQIQTIREKAMAVISESNDAPKVVASHSQAQSYAKNKEAPAEKAPKNSKEEGYCEASATEAERLKAEEQRKQEVSAEAKRLIEEEDVPLYLSPRAAAAAEAARLKSWLKVETEDAEQREKEVLAAAKLLLEEEEMNAAHAAAEKGRRVAQEEEEQNAHKKNKEAATLTSKKGLKKKRGLSMKKLFGLKKN